MTYLLSIFIIAICVVISYILMNWIVTLMLISDDSKHRGIITYARFKEVFNKDEWEAPDIFDNGVLINREYRESRLCVESATYLYEKKAMLPLTPYDLYRINKLIKETVKEKKPSYKSDKRKLFIW